MHVLYKDISAIVRCLAYMKVELMNVLLVLCTFLHRQNLSGFRGTVDRVDDAEKEQKPEIRGPRFSRRRRG